MDTLMRSGTHDTIVIGGSAGSFEALKTLLPGLPADLPAAVFVCKHLSSMSDMRGTDLLAPYSDLPLKEGAENDPIREGEIVFAPLDTHMMIGRNHVHLRRGAHENNFRPAIDPLFRSAAVYRSSRTVAVVLSGLMNDGAAGARAIARCGGRVLVQHPDTADSPDMPRATLEAVPDAEAVPLDRLATRLAEIAGQPCGPAREIPMDIGIELKIASLEGASMSNEERLGELSPYNCPHCNGVLWEIRDGPLTRFRCHTGHAYTIESLSAVQEEALDHGLFDTLRAHKGRAALLRQMAERSSAHGISKKLYLERAKLVEEDAQRLEEIIKSRRAFA